MYQYLVVSDAINRRILQSTIDDWSDRANALYETTQYEYNPIFNVDVTEHTEDTRTDNLNEKSTREDDLTQKTQQKLDEHHDVENVETPLGWGSEEYESGYNTADTPHQTSKTLATGVNRVSNETDIYTSGEGNTIETVNTGDQTIEKVNTGTQKNVHDMKKEGNQGTTSTQSMILEEREVRMLDCLDWYVSHFANDFDLSMDILRSVWEDDEDDIDDL